LVCHPRSASLLATETTDREAIIHAHAVVGDPASERLEASDVVTPQSECLPSHFQIAEASPISATPIELSLRAGVW
jgi:hypothetical protein